VPLSREHEFCTKDKLAVVIADQVLTALKGKRVKSVAANHSPHKFAWFCGDPDGYARLLRGHTVENVISCGGLVEIWAGARRILFGDSVNLRYHPAGDKAPAKHQILIEFDDSSMFSVSVQMYGGLWVFPAGQFDNPHFESLLEGEKRQSLSAKAFLATEQRIPGLGNGVLQDILWTAMIHPKRKMATLYDDELHVLFGSVKSVLKQMAAGGGGTPSAIYMAVLEDTRRSSAETRWASHARHVGALISEPLVQQG